MLRRSSFYSLVVALAIFCFGVNAEAANFAGTWNFNLVGTKDQCGLGLKGRKVPINGVVITQSGKKATLTLQGITYKARVTGKSMKGSGKYSTGSMTISGTIAATLS